MILQSDILKQSQAEKITETLENLIKENNTKVLSERLAITEKQASSISKIEIESVKKAQVIDEKDEKGFATGTKVIITINEETS